MAAEEALQADTVSSADTAEVLKLFRPWHWIEYTWLNL